MSNGEAGRVRLDRWLWAARFFKTRALAADAVNGGKVHLAGQRVKAARSVKIGDCYEIQRGFERLEIVVQALSARRGPASEAQQLYAETEASIQRREQEREQRRLAALARPRTEGRPTKQQRRQIHRFRDRNQS